MNNQELKSNLKTLLMSAQSEPPTAVMVFNNHMKRILRPSLEELISQTGAHNQTKFSDGRLGFYIESYPDVVLTPLFEYYPSLEGFRVQVAEEGDGIIFGRTPLTLF